MGQRFASLDGCKTPIGPLPSLQALHREIRRVFMGNFEKVDGNGIVFLEGGQVSLHYDTDTELAFQQESNFLYLTGVDYPDFYVALDVQTRLTYLMAPRRDVFWAVWNGVVQSLEQIQAEYGVDEVSYTTDYISLLHKLTHNGAKTIYTLTPNLIPGVPNQNATALRPVLAQSRLVKTAPEIEYLEVAANVSSDAHIHVMKDARVGLYEYHLASFFKYYTENCGLLYQSYLPIVGYGAHGAILHYNRPLAPIDGHGLLLIDAGGQFRGFCTDITRTFPIGGKFTPEQRLIYEMVLHVVVTLEAQCKPGTPWRSLHQQMGVILTDLLLEHGFLHGDRDQLYKDRLFSFFCPHSLGHSVGFDVHDPGTIDLLQENMVITIEPGIYFNEVYMNMAFANETLRKHMNIPKIQSFLSAKFGGVRIEDVVLITKDGHRVLSWLPKSVQGIEALMKK